MKAFTKPPLSYPDQVALLVSRGLNVYDQTKAASFLRCTNYYRLSAYCVPFEIKRHQFKENVDFESLCGLYEFDRRLRSIIDEAIEMIEISMRASIAYYIAHNHGAFAHEQDTIFFDRCKGRHPEWLEQVHKETERSKETFIQHYRNTYADFPALPIWMAVEVMSFGALSQLFHNLRRGDQIGIAKGMGFHHRILASWLHTFTYVRNLCAHHSRLWNRELAIAMVLPRRSEWQGLNAKRIGAVIYAIHFFLKQINVDAASILEWKTSVVNLMKSAPKLDQFLHQVGLAENWETSSLWK